MMCAAGGPKRDGVFVTSVSKEDYGGHYENHCIEMYKIAVEMADRISSRRQTSNRFFLTINSGIIAAVGYVRFGQDRADGAEFCWLIALSGIVLCFLWFFLIQSYKNLNSHKYNVIHAIEQILPLRPYGAEWDVAKQGDEPLCYWPLTHIERVIPWVFILTYLLVSLL